MKVVQIEPGIDPIVVDLSARTIEKRLHGLIHEEVLPVDGTMSLSALRTDGLAPNTLMIQLTEDDGYFGTVYICAEWYEGLTREQIYEVLDWLEEGTPPEKDYEVDRWLFEDPPEREEDEYWSTPY